MNGNANGINWHIIATVFGFMLWGILAPLACAIYLDVRDLREKETRMEGVDNHQTERLNNYETRIDTLENRMADTNLKIERLFATADFFSHFNFQEKGRFKRPNE